MSGCDCFDPSAVQCSNMRDGVFEFRSLRGLTRPDLLDSPADERSSKSMK